MIGMGAIRAGLAALTAAVLLAIPGTASAAILWDQNSGGDGSGFFSQEDTAPPVGDLSEVADDFFITGGPVTVRGVHVTGHYEGASPVPASSVTVRLYEDAGTTPVGLPLHTASAVVPVAGVATGDFAIPIPSPFVLGNGQYWISVQANGLDYSDEIWDWDNRPLNGMTAPAAARTTVAAGCMGPGWTKKAVAGCAGATAPEDQMFSLSDVTPTAPPPPPGGGGGIVTPTPTPATPAPKKCRKGQKLKKGKCVKKKRKKKR
jgi:hypothetical protein